MNSAYLTVPQHVVHHPHPHLAALIEQYGYIVTFFGTVLEGELVVVLSAMAAHMGYLSLPLVILVSTLGAVTGDTLFFFLGRNYGRVIVARLPFVQRQTDRAGLFISRYPNISIISFRFIYGLKLSGAILIGMSKVKTVHFLILNLFGSLLWAVSIALIGYTFAATLTYALGNIREFEKLLFGAVVICGCIYYVYKTGITLYQKKKLQ